MAATSHRIPRYRVPQRTGTVSDGAVEIYIASSVPTIPPETRHARSTNVILQRVFRRRCGMVGMGLSTRKIVVLFVRFIVGFAWIQAGVPKLLSDPNWTPGFVLAFMEKAISKSHASSRTWVILDYLTYDCYNWYARWCIINSELYVWLTPLIAWGEILIGLSWMTGCLVWISAWCSLILTLHLGFADSVRTNILFAAASIILIYEWLWAGFYGLDRYVLLRILPRKFTALARIGLISQ
jgi:thiosulfate dehydrogenase (quinone) large subunit